jgi:biopolymer transport protein ExbB/TolQ
MRNLLAARWLSSGRQTLLSIVVAVILVFSIIALLKVNSGAKQAPAEELLTGSIPRLSAVRKSPNDSMAAFLALDSTQSAIQPMQRAADRAAVPLPRPRPKRL